MSMMWCRSEMETSSAGKLMVSPPIAFSDVDLGLLPGSRSCCVVRHAIIDQLPPLSRRGSVVWSPVCAKQPHSTCLNTPWMMWCLNSCCLESTRYVLILVIHDIQEKDFLAIAMHLLSMGNYGLPGIRYPNGNVIPNPKAKQPGNLYLSIL